MIKAATQETREKDPSPEVEWPYGQDIQFWDK